MGCRELRLMHPDCLVSQGIRWPLLRSRYRQDGARMSTPTPPRRRPTGAPAFSRRPAASIVREGAHGLRMARVAEEAGVSKALVHYYFSTRQELLRKAFAFSEQRWQAAIDAEIAPSRPVPQRSSGMLLVSVEPALAFSEQRALWNEVWSSLRSDDGAAAARRALVPRVARPRRRADRGGKGRRLDRGARWMRRPPAGGSRPPRTASTRSSTSTSSIATSRSG